MSEERNNPIDESLLTNVLPLDESIIEICKTMSTEIEAHDEDLLKLSQMPFFGKLTDDKKTRYIKEFKIKKALKVFSEGKKPENISDRQWKHVMKLRFQELTRDAYKEYNLEKKKKQKEKKREQKKEKGEDAEKVIVVKEKTERVSNKIKLVIDCSFDDLMLPKEVKSMSTQITRIYNCNKLSNSPFEEILVTSFNKRLRTRFENEITSYKKWSQEGNLKFVDDDIFEDNADIIPESYIYLSADSSEELVDFEESKTYVIGGIVDKGRYKKLCYEKANKLGIKTARLPIGKYIKMHGNKVLTSLHVVQLMNEYLKNGKNWELAFDTVMPKRKVIE